MRRRFSLAGEMKAELRGGKGRGRDEDEEATRLAYEVAQDNRKVGEGEKDAQSLPRAA